MGNFDLPKRATSSIIALIQQHNRRKDMKTVGLMVYLDEDLRRAAKIKAVQTNTSMSEVCRRFLRKWVAEAESEKIDANRHNYKQPSFVTDKEDRERNAN